MTTFPSTKHGHHRLARCATVALVVVVGFFAAQGEAADAQQLRVAPSEPAGRFTTPAPLAGAQPTLGSSAGVAHAPGRARVMTPLVAIVGPTPVAEDPLLVAHLGRDRGVADVTSCPQPPIGRSPPTPAVI